MATIEATGVTAGAASAPSQNLSTISEEFERIQDEINEFSHANTSSNTSRTDDAVASTSFGDRDDTLGTTRGTLRSNVCKLEFSDAKTGDDDQDDDTVDKVFLCCSREEPKDFQVELCERSWFDLCNATNFLHAVWKVIFIIICLPLCYPCYLTRKCRYRRKRTLDTSSNSHATPQKVPVTRAHKV